MSTYTEFHNKAGENLQIRNHPGYDDDRMSFQEVKLSNDNNEYYGTFHGAIDARSVAMTSVLLSNVIIVDSELCGDFKLSSGIDLNRYGELFIQMSGAVATSADSLSNAIKKETEIRISSDIDISNSLSVISVDLYDKIGQISGFSPSKYVHTSGDMITGDLSIEGSFIQTTGQFKSSPSNGLSGFWIGDETIASILSDIQTPIEASASNLCIEISTLRSDVNNYRTSDKSELSNVLSSYSNELCVSLSTEVSSKGYVTPYDYSFNYVDHEIVLSVRNANGQSVSSSINTAKFEEGRMLSAVDRVKEDGKWYLRLVFKLEDGSAKEVKIPLNDFIEVYKSGSGISIDLSTLTISVDDTIARLQYVNDQDDILSGLILHNVSSIELISSETIPYISGEVSCNSNDISHKIFISSETHGEYSDLSVITIGKRTYDEMVISGTLSVLSNSIFIVSSDYIDAYGQQMKNLSGPSTSSDAANKQYVDAVSSLISSDVSNVVSSVYDAIQNLSDSVSAEVSSQLCSLSSTTQKNISDLSDSLSNSVTSLIDSEQQARAAHDKYLSSQISTNVSDLSYLSGQISSSCNDIEFLSSEVSSNNNDITFLSSSISSKIWVEDLPEYSNVSGYSDLSVIKIKKDDYENKVINEPTTLDGSTIYVVDATVIDAYGQSIVNLSTPGVDGVSNAANKGFVQAHVANALATLSVSDITLSSADSAVLSSITVVRENNGKLELDAKILEIENVDQLCSNLSSLNDSIEHKVWISAVNVSKYDNLSVITITRDTYDEMLTEGKLSSLSNSVFVVSSDYIDAFGEQLKNLSYPTDNDDAATKLYVDTMSSSISTTVSSIESNIYQAIQNLSDSVSSSVGTDVYNLCCSVSATLSSSITSVSASADKIVSDLSDSISNSVTSLVGAEAGIRELADSFLSNAISSKIWIEDPTVGLSSYSDLSVIKIDKTTYETGVATDSPLICSNTIYVIEQTNIDAYGQVLSNLRTTGVYEVAEAANVKYVDQKITQAIQNLSSDPISLSADENIISVITSISEGNGKISIEGKRLVSSDVENLGGYVDDKFKAYTSVISASLSAVDKLSALTTDSTLEDVAQGVCDIRDMLSSLTLALKLMS